MKTGMTIDNLKVRDLLETQGEILTDQYGKNYYRLPMIFEEIGLNTMVVHLDNDTDVPGYLVQIRAEFIANRHFSKENLSEPGKDWKGNKLTVQDLPPGTLLMCGDGNEYIVTEEKSDGVFVNIDPVIKGGLKFHRADIELVRLMKLQ